MAQSFVSTYRNHYRWNHPVRPPPFPPHDQFDDYAPPSDLWYDWKSVDVGLSGEAADKWISKLYRKRMVTSYQRDYCKPVKSSESKPDKTVGDDVPPVVEKSFESELMNYCQNLYEPVERPKIIAPIPGTRRMFGYVRPTNLYTPWSTYQHAIGRVGYMVLKGETKDDSRKITVGATSPQALVNAEKLKALEDQNRCCYNLVIK